MRERGFKGVVCTMGETAVSTARKLQPTAMTLATVGGDGQPSARLVLLKSVDERGFVFYTNVRSRKGRELAGNPKVAMCFHWKRLERQVLALRRLEKIREDKKTAVLGEEARAAS
mgnify:CR=1 FL=1